MLKQDCFKLIFVWLGERKDRKSVFSKEGYRFSSKYDVLYDVLKTRLTIKKNNSYIDDFYNIENNNLNLSLTFIVGKNGAGKTRLLNLIREFLSDNVGFLESYKEFLIIWEENETIYFDSNITFKRVSRLLVPKKFPTSSNPKVIHYDNLLNDYGPTFSSNHWPNVYDLTLNNLLESEAIDFYDNYQVDRKTDKLILFKIQELKSKVLFYAKNINFYDHYSLGNSLKREFIFISPFESKYELHRNRFSNPYKNDVNLSKDFNAFIRLLDDIEKYFTNKILTSNLADVLLWKFAHSYWLLVLDYFSNYIKEILIPYFCLKNLRVCELTEDLSPEQIITYVINTFIKIFNKSNNNKLDISEFNTISMAFEKFAITVRRIQSEKTTKSIENDKLKINIEKNADLLERLIDEYAESLKHLLTGEFVVFNFFPELSAGEYSLLTILSRIYACVVYKKHGLDAFKIRDVYLLIDEGEIGFHPKWQKHYVYMLLKYIGCIFNEINTPEVKNLHLIVTTNSPLLLSDVLPEDIIFLNNMKVDTNKHLAFGSNILDLYCDSFYIDNGLIGDFAQEKINEIIRYIESGRMDKEDAINTLIEKIGDVNIRCCLYKYLKHRKMINR